jgi:CubicO group peptidase (beta-lactamase class C family)
LSISKAHLAPSGPGERFFYSNRVTNLLASVVLQASGKRLDTWAKDHLFEPLGITDFSWSEDAAGNVRQRSAPPRMQMAARNPG